jgi:hypothetical protein
MWSTVNEVKLVKAPFYELGDPFLVEVIGWLKEVIPDNVQCSCPDGGTPIMQNISSLEMYVTSYT